MSQTIQAERIEIVDKQGRVLMVLGSVTETPASGARPFLSVQNAEGLELIKIGIEDDSMCGTAPVLRMLSADGNMGLDLSLDDGAGLLSIGPIDHENDHREPGDGIERAPICEGSWIGSGVDGQSKVRVTEGVFDALGSTALRATELAFGVEDPYDHQDLISKIKAASATAQK